MWQAGVYSTVMHYLKAIEAAGTNEPLKVAAKREDGLMVHELMLVQVKKAGGFEVPLGLLSDATRRTFATACTVKPPHLASLTTKAFSKKGQTRKSAEAGGQLSTVDSSYTRARRRVAKMVGTQNEYKATRPHDKATAAHCLS